MHVAGESFFVAAVTDQIVRNGADARLPIDVKSGRSSHSAVNVYREMLLQICRDYAGLPDPRTLTQNEICFFYNGLREELKRHAR